MLISQIEDDTASRPLLNVATLCTNVIKAWALTWQAASINSLSVMLFFFLCASSKRRDVLQLVPPPWDDQKFYSPANLTMAKCYGSNI